ncbi:hypothetical protein KR044_010599 [Drosophila immigrans]|nr:hypothetical protein KR044_010599 [Drosophila immigrans]
MSVNLIKQGAEGRLYLGDFKGESCLIKERFVKKYRHPELDTQITRQRMKAEVKAAGRCLAAGILAPRMFHSDLTSHKLYMEYFDSAQTAKQFIQSTVAASNDKQAKEVLLELCKRIGAVVGQMHANNIIHGDLTTSNILVNPNSPAKSEYDVILIDFGLSHYNQGAEDKGVDLYVLERALLSTHSEQKNMFEFILAEYRRNCGKDKEVVLAKFDEVRARGRKRTMIG